MCLACKTYLFYDIQQTNCLTFHDTNILLSFNNYANKKRYYRHDIITLEYILNSCTHTHTETHKNTGVYNNLQVH